jgi:hypothetical protein
MSATVHYLPGREPNISRAPVQAETQQLTGESPADELPKSFLTVWDFAGVPILAIPAALAALVLWIWYPVVFAHIRSLF